MKRSLDGVIKEFLDLSGILKSSFQGNFLKKELKRGNQGLAEPAYVKHVAALCYTLHPFYDWTEFSRTAGIKPGVARAWENDPEFAGRVEGFRDRLFEAFLDGVQDIDRKMSKRKHTSENMRLRSQTLTNFLADVVSGSPFIIHFIGQRLEHLCSSLSKQKGSDAFPFYQLTMLYYDFLDEKYGNIYKTPDDIDKRIGTRKQEAALLWKLLTRAVEEKDSQLALGTIETLKSVLGSAYDQIGELKKRILETKK